MLLNMWWIRLIVILLTYLTGDLGLSDIKIWKFGSTQTQHGNGRPRHLHIRVKKVKFHFYIALLESLRLSVELYKLTSPSRESHPTLV